jgi:hypothetical protein
MTKIEACVNKAKKHVKTNKLHMKEIKKLARVYFGYHKNFEELYQKELVRQRSLRAYHSTQKKSTNYRNYKREYETSYRAKNRKKWNLKSVKCIYKKKFPTTWRYHLKKYEELR